MSDICAACGSFYNPKCVHWPQCTPEREAKQPRPSISTARVRELAVSASTVAIRSLPRRAEDAIIDAINQALREAGVTVEE